jgi:branched-chain amino acid transport system ATP-binding protein
MLDVERVRVGYGVATALWDVSISVRDGELVCVVGPNGAGKTTLINAIAGINPVRSGRVAIGGRDVSRLPAHRHCEQGVAIVPEGRRLFGAMTVRENLELGGYVAHARRHRDASIARVCALFPALVEKLERPAASLSGGQQQMVAIGRALMAKPRLLLLDEPSLGLAPMIVVAMFDAIRAVNAEGIAVLLVEQNVAIAMDVASRAYVLDEGRVVADGAPDELRARPEIRRAYLGI